MTVFLCTRNHFRVDDGTLHSGQVSRVRILTDPIGHRDRILLTDPEYSLREDGHLWRERPLKKREDGTSDIPRPPCNYQTGVTPDPRPDHPAAADLHEIWWETL